MIPINVFLMTVNSFYAPCVVGADRVRGRAGRYPAARGRGRYRLPDSTCGCDSVAAAAGMEMAGEQRLAHNISDEKPVTS